MKTELKFVAKDQAEQKELLEILKYKDYYCALWDICEEFRRVRKYGLKQKEVQASDFALETIHEILKERNIDI